MRVHSENFEIFCQRGLRNAKFRVKYPIARKVLPTRFSREGGQRGSKFRKFLVKGTSETRNFGSKGGHFRENFFAQHRARRYFFRRRLRKFLHETYSSRSWRARSKLATGVVLPSIARATPRPRDLRIANRAHRPWGSDLVIERPSLRTADSILGPGIGDPRIRDSISGEVTPSCWGLRTGLGARPGSVLTEPSAARLCDLGALAQRLMPRRFSRSPRSVFEGIWGPEDRFFPWLGSRTAFGKKLKKMPSEGPEHSTFSTGHRCEKIGHTWCRKKN